MNKVKKRKLKARVKTCYDEWANWTKPGNLDLMPPPEMLDNLVRIFKYFGHDINKNRGRK